MSHLVDEYANKLCACRGVVIYNRVFPVCGEGTRKDQAVPAVVRGFVRISSYFKIFWSKKVLVEWLLPN